MPLHRLSLVVDAEAHAEDDGSQEAVQDITSSGRPGALGVWVNGKDVKVVNGGWGNLKIWIWLRGFPQPSCTPWSSRS